MSLQNDDSKTMSRHKPGHDLGTEILGYGCSWPVKTVLILYTLIYVKQVQQYILGVCAIPYLSFCTCHFRVHWPTFMIPNQKFSLFVQITMGNKTHITGVTFNALKDVTNTLNANVTMSYSQEGSRWEPYVVLPPIHSSIHFQMVIFLVFRKKAQLLMKSTAFRKTTCKEL